MPLLKLGNTFNQVSDNFNSYHKFGKYVTHLTPHKTAPLPKTSVKYKLCPAHSMVLDYTWLSIIQNIKCAG